VAKWRGIYGNVQNIKQWLLDLNIKELHVESEHVDLTVDLGEQRKWVGISGRNIPSFEIFTSPDSRGTNGRYYADQPSYRNGNYVKGVALLFEKGELVEASADQGEDFLKEQIAMDEGASRVGEFSLTDRRFSKIDLFMANTLYDENFGGPNGNCHLALGNSYENTFTGDRASLNPDGKKRLGFNQSALHWDLVNTEKKTVTAKLASGKKIVVYEDGEFTC
jgi:aminopeptidase